ncbi:unnamed protein product [Aphanomyces euteiches]|nr:hypothetical protein AeRB84_020793 [Aphanomyces euteiches]
MAKSTAAVCMAIALSSLHLSSAASQPGQCKADTDCTTYGTGYSCISVQTDIAGITLASQCVLGSACGGNIAGKCPTFSSWSTSYQKIRPVCALVAAENCQNVTATTTVAPNTSTTAKPTTVECFSTTYSDGNSSVLVTGIYKCVDADIYESSNLGGIANLTAKQLKQCQGNTTAAGLCNGHGTCAPSSSLSSSYQCICNQGYSSSDNCLVAISNVCDNFGSCGSGNTCDSKTGQCICTGGTQGSQCSLCNASSSLACNGNGKCDALEGTCTCNSGYTGSLCDTKNSTSSGGSSGGTSGGSSTGGTTSAAYKTQGIQLLALAIGLLALVA